MPHASFPSGTGGKKSPRPISFPARKGHCDVLPNALKRRVLNAPDNAHSIAAAKFLALHLGLTSRQAQVLHWMAEGKTNQEIALILECSFFTVKNHVKEIFARLGVSSRVGAAAAAYRTHLATSDGVKTAGKSEAGRRRGQTKRKKAP